MLPRFNFSTNLNYLYFLFEKKRKYTKPPQQMEKMEKEFKHLSDMNFALRR